MFCVYFASVFVHRSGQPLFCAPVGGQKRAYWQQPQAAVNRIVDKAGFQQTQPLKERIVSRLEEYKQGQVKPLMGAINRERFASRMEERRQDGIDTEYLVSRYPNLARLIANRRDLGY